MSSVRWTRVEELFGEAVRLPAPEREALLARACGDDAALRQEVETLLAADGEARDFLSAPAHPAAAAAAGAAEGAATPTLVGRRIGRYRVEAKLGQGGMSTVYLAVRADEVYQQKVALKVLDTGFERADLVQRFRAERQILASLDHPGIARLLDGGTTRDGRPYLVMECIEGVPLDRYCDQHRLSLEARIDLFRQVCAAVSYAHQNLVVHRDIKPSNILVGADGVPRLLDFGIAKLLEGAEVAGAGLGGAEATRTGQRLMTPQYASPEQVAGAPITTASDVYSLGVLLYVLLTGRLPYRLQADRPDSLERAVVEQDAERPSTAMGRSGGETARLEAVGQARGLRPKQLRRRLRGDLETILLMALRKEPQRRYASVSLLSEDLRRFRLGLPILARPDGSGYRLRRFVGRHKLAVSAAAAGLLVISGLAVTMTFLAVRLARQRDEIVRERDHALEVRSFLEEVFAGSDPGATGGESVTARELLDEGAARVLAKLSQHPDTQASLALAIGKVYLSLGLNDRAEPLLRQSLLERERGGRPSLDLAESLLALSVLDQNLGDFQAAEARQRRALAVQRALLPPADARIGDTLTDLSVTLLARARYEEAEAVVREALAIHRASPRGAEGAAYDLNNLGSVLRRSGRLAEAEGAYREALAAARAVFGPAHPQLTRTINNLGVVLMDVGDPAGAEPLAREALEMTRKLYGEEHPDVALQLSNLASVLGARGDTEAWVAASRRALAMRQRLFGPDHEQVAMSLLNLGNALEQERDFRTARALYEDALRIQRKVHGDVHPRVAQVLGDLAEMDLTRGDAVRAEPPARQALAIRQQTLGEDHADVGRSLSTLGAVRFAAGEAREAEPLLRAGLAILQAALPPGHWKVGEAESRLGACLAALGSSAEAEALLTEGYRHVLAGRGPGNTRTEAARARLRAFSAPLIDPRSASRVREGRRNP